MYEHDIALAVQDPAFLSRFWAKVEKSDGCWLWTGTCFRTGYGRIVLPRKYGGHSATTHRLAWLLANGAIPDGLWILHRCDNRPCVNPAHLFIGTNATNVADKVAKGRCARMHGESNPLTKFSEATLDAFRTDAATRTGTINAVRLKYGISQSHATAILKGRYRAHRA